MARLFGTDGVRGIANSELTCKLAFRLGQAAALKLGKTILVGRDTRLSGDMLESALSAGIMSVGGTALLAGIIPTPGVALLTRELFCDAGVVISASHNPPEYNGIKFFDSQGYKLPDEMEDEFEDIARTGVPEELLAVGDALGVAIPVEDACQTYVDHAVATVSQDGVRFDGMKVALDAAHGAAALSSASALRALGAEVVVINDEFDGTDINVACGSTHLEPLRELVKSSGADVGIAHDGDADRVMLMDADGREIDGDMIEAVCALDLKKRGLLMNNTVVSTVMCNLGFVHAMRDAGIAVKQTKVGDRYVLECMREHGYVLGGEQSGHMIFSAYNSTGDGLVTALQYLAACRRAGKSAGEMARVMTRYPQQLINVRVADKHALPDCTAVWKAVAQVEAQLGDEGRVLIRTSGTEPVVRVMVEAASEESAQTFCESLAEVVKYELGE